MTDRELMQQALDALERYENGQQVYFDDEIEALRARLAQPEQEPVAGNSERYCVDCCKELEPHQEKLCESCQSQRLAHSDLLTAPPPQPEPKVYSDVDEMFRDMGVPVTEQEPVAWWDGVGRFATVKEKDWDRRTGGILSFGRDIPLYSAPPQREWQGLTDEEIMNLIHDVRWQNMVVTTHYLARAIEAKLKEKNAPASPS